MEGGGGEERRRLAELGPGPGSEPWAPALDLVSCSPGQQLEGRRERKGGVVAEEDIAETLEVNFNRETESERRLRGIRKEKKCREIERERRKKQRRGERVVVAEVWKEDSGKAIRFL